MNSRPQIEIKMFDRNNNEINFSPHGINFVVNNHKLEEGNRMSCEGGQILSKDFLVEKNLFESKDEISNSKINTVYDFSEIKIIVKAFEKDFPGIDLENSFPIKGSKIIKIPD